VELPLAVCACVEVSLVESSLVELSLAVSPFAVNRLSVGRTPDVDDQLSVEMALLSTFLLSFISITSSGVNIRSFHANFPQSFFSIIFNIFKSWNSSKAFGMNLTESHEYVEIVLVKKEISLPLKSLSISVRV
jgi:hypothetical protein